MLKDKLKNLADNPNHISGIYNYCDRWCERCAFTSRCLNYDISKEQFEEPESRDMNNKLFWEKLGETFQATFELINEVMEEKGIDISSIDDEEYKKEKKRIDDEVDSNDLKISTVEYGDMASQWFKSSENLFEEKEIDLNQQANLELPNENPDKEAASIKDAVEVIMWYQHFIQVKLMRAIRGELREYPEEIEEFPKDSDGSAKVALIAIDRSIAAWGELLKFFPEQEDELFAILIKLEQLRRHAEELFPNARAFMRPGFDE